MREQSGVESPISNLTGVVRKFAFNVDPTDWRQMRQK